MDRRYCKIYKSVVNERPVDKRYWKIYESLANARAMYKG